MHTMHFTLSGSQGYHTLMMLPKGLLKEYAHTLVWLMRLVDALLLLAAGVLAYEYRFHAFPSWMYAQALLLSAVVAFPIFSFCGMYRSFRRDSFSDMMMTLTQGIVCLSLFLLALAFVMKIGFLYSRLWFFSWILLSWFFLVLFRTFILMTLRVMRRYGLNERQIVLIGSGAMVKQILKQLQQSLWTGLRVIAVISDDANDLDDNIPVHAMPDNLTQWLTSKRADECWIASSLPMMNDIQTILFALRHSMITTRCILDFQCMDLLNYSVSEIGGMPLFTLRSSPMVGLNRLIKAIEDRVLSAFILICISPILLMIALLIKLTSKGPVFYKQARMGWNGLEFDMLKFRTMPVNSESRTGPVWATAADQRPTRLGKWLRRLSLDELPQFINVLKGDMSIVGPRPERKVFVDQFKDRIPRYMQKHYVKAGITGWAQVNGWRGNTSLEKRIEFDLYYIEHWSLWFDLKIILLTVVRGFVHPNAY